MTAVAVTSLLIHYHGVPLSCLDMYTFDVSEEDAIATYHEVCAEYESIFSALNLPVSKGRVNMVDRVWEKICVLCYCSKG